LFVFRQAGSGCAHPLLQAIYIYILRERGGWGGGVPRERKVGSARLLVLYFDAALYEELRRAAEARGLSMSELVRLLVAEWLSHQSVSAASGAADPPAAPPDPLLQVEVEDLERGLSKLEADVERLEREVAHAQQLGWGLSSYSSRSLSREQAYGRLSIKLQRWHSLRRLYTRLSPHIPPADRERLASRLAALKRRLNKLEEAIH